MGKNLDDTLMVKFFGNMHLLNETLVGLGVGGQFTQDKLDRDLTGTKACFSHIGGKINLAHTTLSDGP